MNRNINDSIPEEMAKISKKIAIYADTLKNDMKKLLSTHSAMHTSWQGKQYDDFSRIIEDVNKVIVKQTEKLITISGEVAREAAQLRIANDKKLG